MWICRQCGEPHQDQFKECWKCIGAQMNEHVTAEPPKPTPALPEERRLRPLGSILLRASIGFMVGMLVSLSSFNFINPKTFLPSEWIISSTDKVVLGIVVGAIFGTLVGLFVWVVFPYEPIREPGKPTETDEKSTPLSD